PAQVYGRLRLRLSYAKPDLSPAPSLRQPACAWRRCKRPSSMRGPSRFQFLNVEREIIAAADWNHVELDKLWLYNLHYFNDLGADDCEARESWHDALVNRWMSENPPGHGN